MIPRLVVVAAIGLAACVGSTSSEPLSSGPFYTVALDTGIVADSSSLAAGSVVPVRVRVSHAGSIVAGITVGWTVASGHGLVTSATTTTDSLGVGSMLWTLGDTIGANALTIAAGDGTLTLHINGVPGPASALARISADSSAVAAGSSLSLGVQVQDRLGNAVSGATVVWASSGGTLSVVTSKTDATGKSQVTLVAPKTPGTYDVTATLPDRASVTFRVVTF